MLAREAGPSGGADVRRRDREELAIRSLLARLAEGTGAVTEPALRQAARAAAAEGRSPEQRPARTRPWRPLRARFAAAGAAALLVATGLGFGVASWLTPAASSARPDVEGLGFLPATGWTVVQAGLSGSSESARAIAANVPITPADPQQAAFGFPQLPALHSWPSWGIVIVATLQARGDPARDAAFPVRELPLHLADAVPVGKTERVLRAGVGGYNVEASIGFGSEPTTEMLEAAEDQIARLVVAPAAITIAVRPTVYGRQGPLVVSGSVSNGRKDERVTVQFKQCGLYPLQFRDLFEVLTEEGGGWSAGTGIPANGVLRAVFSGDVSDEVPVKARADVRLQPVRTGGYEVNVVARWSFWRKKIVIQRFDRGRAKWQTVQTLLLDDAGAAGGSSFVWSTTGTFKPKVAKKTTIRAVLPLDQAKPCFIGGYSNLLVTK
jgi:hypothetical protein